MQRHATRTGTIQRVAFAAVLLSLFALPAGAADFVFDTQIRSGEVGDFATVQVEEDGAGGLHFTVEMNEAEFDHHAHMKKLYFNLATDVSGLMIHSTDPVRRPYRLIDRRSWNRKFDFKVYFGRHHWHRSTDDMNTMTFTLSADQWLGIDDLTMPTMLKDEHEVHMAAVVMERGPKRHRKWRRHRHHYRMHILGGSMVAEEPVDDPNPGEDDGSGDDDGGDGGHMPLDPDNCPFPLYDGVTLELISCT